MSTREEGRSYNCYRHLSISQQRRVKDLGIEVWIGYDLDGDMYVIKHRGIDIASGVIMLDGWLDRELQAREDWRAYCRSGNKPADIPARPDVAYPGEWMGWADWIGRAV